MTAEELVKKYAMEAHVENGAFLECHYPHDGAERAASGSIYYYVAPTEKTAFHRIDCDEYWCYTAGSTLELWQVDTHGCLTKTLLGTEGGAVPFVYLPKGTIFASRHPAGAAEGTFVVCITVPRFSYDGFEMFSQEQIRRDFPEAAAFFED